MELERNGNVPHRSLIIVMWRSSAHAQPPEFEQAQFDQLRP